MLPKMAKCVCSKKTIINFREFWFISLIIKTQCDTFHYKKNIFFMCSKYCALTVCLCNVEGVWLQKQLYPAVSCHCLQSLFTTLQMIEKVSSQILLESIPVICNNPFLCYLMHKEPTQTN